MKTKMHKAGSRFIMSLVLIVLMSALCVSVYAIGPEEDYVPDDTDGTELQVMQPSQLEIRLGSEWAGAEFELETDVGDYPGTVPVSADGTLRMEIGGSETYILRLVETPAEPPVRETPEPTPEPAPETPEIPEEPEPEPEEPADEIPAELVPEERNESNPIIPIAIFGVGILVAVGVLIAMRVIGKGRDQDGYDDGSENDG